MLECKAVCFLENEFGYLLLEIYDCFVYDCVAFAYLYRYKRLKGRSKNKFSKFILIFFSWLYTKYKLKTKEIELTGFVVEEAIIGLITEKKCFYVMKFRNFTKFTFNILKIHVIFQFF